MLYVQVGKDKVPVPRKVEAKGPEAVTQHLEHAIRESRSKKEPSKSDESTETKKPKK